MKLNGSSYELLCLGKNGEPKPSQPVTINFIHKKLNSIPWVTLVTDERGAVYLGKLSQIKSVHVQHGRIWQLPSLENDEWAYPLQMDQIVGDSIEIPVSGLSQGELSRQEITLIRS